MEVQNIIFKNFWAQETFWLKILLFYLPILHFNSLDL